MYLHVTGVNVFETKPFLICHYLLLVLLVEVACKISDIMKNYEIPPPRACEGLGLNSPREFP